MNRSADPGLSIWSYLFDSGGVWVACPKCLAPARIKIELTEDRKLPETVELLCTGCSHRPSCEFPSNPQAPKCYGCGTRRIDRPVSWSSVNDITPSNSRERCEFCRAIKHGFEPYSGRPFFLTGKIGGKEIWALNRRHLVDMKMFLGATLRERNHQHGLSLTAMARLPAWTKVASMRPKIVRSIDKMLGTADRYHLP